MKEEKPRKKRAPTPDEIQAAAARQLSEVLKRLRQKIREQGFTQSRVEQEMGWEQNTISALVGGRIALQFDHLFAICEVIDVSPIEILGTGPAADRVLTKLLRTYAHPREALGDFKESELLAAAEKRLTQARGKSREYLRDVIQWCQSSKKLAEQAVKRRASKERLSEVGDPGVVFPTFKKKARRK